MPFHHIVEIGDEGVAYLGFIYMTEGITAILYKNK